MYTNTHFGGGWGSEHFQVGKKSGLKGGGGDLIIIVCGFVV